MQNDHDNFDANTIRKEKLLIVDPRYAVEIESYVIF